VRRGYIADCFLASFRSLNYAISKTHRLIKWDCYVFWYLENSGSIHRPVRFRHDYRIGRPGARSSRLPTVERRPLRGSNRPARVGRIRPLEDRFPLPGPDLPPLSGIIVLGGETDPELSAARHLPILAPQAGRLTVGAALARRFPQTRLIFSGGSAGLRDLAGTEAEAVRQLWIALGVPPQQMLFETQSRNTWENALFTRAVVRPTPGETFLLVTSAYHMPRSIGIFRKAGFKVLPYPADYMTFGDSRDYVPIHLEYDNLEMLTAALHEWIGLAAYHLTGKTSAWFPAP
jgi:uncharacterized SAM-binding protein YcdF (DUF218 family)